MSGGHTRKPGRLLLLPNGCDAFGATIETLASCSRPVVFETGIEGADYSVWGTCFLASFRRHFFVVAAKHSLGPSDGNDVRIPTEVGSGGFIPFQALHKISVNGMDSDFSDLAVLEGESRLFLEAGVNPTSFLPLDRLIHPKLVLDYGTKLFLRGFPLQLNGPDYERLVIHEQGYILSGTYVGPGTARHVSCVRFDDLDAVESLDGLSGSPVFFVEEEQDHHTFGFAGVLIQGTKSSGIGYFIEAPVLFAVLHKIAQDFTTPKE